MIAALLSLASPVSAQEPKQRIGSWTVGPHQEDSRRCIMGMEGDDGSVLFGARSQPNPEPTFMFGGKGHRLAPTKQTNSGIEVHVDGRVVPMRLIPTIGDEFVALFDARDDKGGSDLLAAFESGRQVVVQAQGRRATFEVEQTREAVAALVRCEASAKPGQPKQGEQANGSVASAPPARAATAAAAETAATQSPDAGFVGDWQIAPAEPDFSGGCLMARVNPDGSALLLHQERPQAGVSFGIHSEGFDLQGGWRGQTALVVDGHPIRFLSIRALEPSTLFSVVADDSADFIDRLRRGRSATFEFEGSTFRFDLQGFTKAIPTFAECVATHDRTLASVQTGNRVNGALGITLAPAVDPTTAVEPLAGSPEDGLEEEEETPPSGGDPMAALLDGPAAYAQLRCSIPALALVGLHGANARPVDFDISINDDASASVNGTSITPVAHRTDPSGSAPTVAVYRASEVYGAIAGSPLGEMFANSPRPPQDAFEKGFLELLTNPGSLVPQNRLLSVSLVNDEVTVADQMPDGGFGNRTTHRCDRLL